MLYRVYSHVRRIRSLVYFAFVGGVIAITACSESIGCPGGAIYTADPAVTITAAINRQTGDTVPQYTIKDVRLDGNPYDVAYLITTTNTSREPKATAKVDGAVLRCTGLCSWGDRAGTYQFTVAAPGIADQIFVVKAGYAKNVSKPEKCISQDREGLLVTLLL